MEEAKNVASKQLIDAFNEGYELGRKAAEKIYN